MEGLVKYPGTYIKNNNFSFFDLIQDFNGFLNDASLDGKIIRENKLDDLLNQEDPKENASFLNLSETDSSNVKVEIKPYIEFGVDVKNILATNGANSKYNLILNHLIKLLFQEKTILLKLQVLFNSHPQLLILTH